MNIKWVKSILIYVKAMLKMDKKIYYKKYIFLQNVISVGLFLFSQIFRAKNITKLKQKRQVHVKNKQKWASVNE